MSMAARHIVPEEAPLQTRFSDDQICEIAEGNSEQIAAWIAALAAQYKVSYRERPSDRFAQVVSRLADAETDMDATEETLLALIRAGLLSTYQTGLLLVRYLR